ncbi:MAG: hypothetical protein LQ350_004383 [Teloschistes chrysophthalmus]|nr:MAG: hypothetical protein LQ350_004383 [Niorma chrysophthalma]
MSSHHHDHHPAIADALRADPAEIQNVLQRSRALWGGGYVDAAKKDTVLPAECGVLRNVLGRVPKFPGRVVETEGGGMSELRYETWETGFEIKGTSTWSTSTDGCELRSKTMSLKLHSGVSKSRQCVLTTKTSFAEWPGIRERDAHATAGNHLAILIMAWAYILSARWAELQSSDETDVESRPRGITYSDVQAGRATGQDEIAAEALEIDIGETDEPAARWWAAVLAAGEGWHAEFEVKGRTYKSPWSAHLAPDPSIILRCKTFHSSSDSTSGPADTDFESPPSSRQALQWLQDYSDRQGVLSQCIPALAASLFLPTKMLSDSEPVALPLPRMSRRALLLPRPSLENPTETAIQHEWNLIPYYMTLSLYHWGLRAVLSGSFFNSAVPCNLVNPWLQPAIECIGPIIDRGDLKCFAAVMSQRPPDIAALWVGAVIMGLEKPIWFEASHGWFSTELQAAAWTKSFQTFIHLPLGNSTGREDGVNWRWETDDGLSREDRGFRDTDAIPYWDGGYNFRDTVPSSVPASKALSSESLSEWATQNVFHWLRAEGFPSDERDIFNHEWLEMGGSSDESEEDVDSIPEEQEKTAMVHEWIENVLS